MFPTIHEPAMTDWPPPTGDHLDTGQVAALLAMSTQEVTRGAREGWLPAHREGHAWQFDRGEVRAHPAGSGCQADEVDM
jgi:hypothetical protein